MTKVIIIMNNIVSPSQVVHLIFSICVSFIVAENRVLIPYIVICPVFNMGKIFILSPFFFSFLKLFIYSYSIS